ncbi:hypothetical protein [Quadrisphaera granulorum]|uniref:hypothetical protein n=1 Tax=Quadrisphaera granulorum TaxID=317664 RepID=UPI0011B7D6E2|nr:hypothetical protein [Quadrisphaera granulorum]
MSPSTTDGASSARSTVRTRTTAGSPGSVGVLLDGRYRLLQRRTRDGAAATWDGEDDQLLRPVVITVVSGPTAAEAVDAARRTATLEDDRLPHLLDVGLDRAADGTALGWVVTERPQGRTLAELLREAPLPAARARALVGEAAAVLARGSISGLHHRRLEPSSIVLTADGAVSVMGLEVAAAAAGAPARTPAESDREDAEGLVRVLYAALTGLWPAGRCGALGAAPTGRGGSPVAPGELALAVPHDMDALCATVLGPYREGPATPAEVASALAPWGSSAGPVTRTALGLPATPVVMARPLVHEAGAPASSWGSAPAQVRLGGDPGVHFAGQPDETLQGEGTQQDDDDDRAVAAPSAGEPAEQLNAERADQPAVAVLPTRAARRAAQRRAEREAELAAGGEDAFEALLGPVTGPRSAVPPSTAVPTAPGATAPVHSGPADRQEVRRTPQAPSSQDAHGERVDRPTAPFGAPTAAGSTIAAPRPRPAAKRHPSAPVEPVRLAPGPVSATTRSFSDTDATDWVSEGWGHAPARAGAAEEEAYPEPEQRRRRTPALAVLVVLVLVLLVAAVVLVPRVPQIAGMLGIAPSTTSAAPAAGAAAPGSPSTGAAAGGAPSAAAQDGGSVALTSALAEDPFGDSSENDDATGRAIDGDPATSWRSSTYSNPALGNLKRGVGLALVVGDGTTPATVSSLELRTEGTGGRLEVRSSPDGGYEGSTVVATVDAGTDGRTVEVPLDEPTSTTHLLLWFTELPQTSSGFAAAVQEVSAR